MRYLLLILLWLLLLPFPSNASQLDDVKLWYEYPDSQDIILTMNFEEGEPWLKVHRDDLEVSSESVQDLQVYIAFSNSTEIYESTKLYHDKRATFDISTPWTYDMTFRIFDTKDTILYEMEDKKIYWYSPSAKEQIILDRITAAINRHYLTSDNSSFKAFSQSMEELIDRWNIETRDQRIIHYIHWYMFIYGVQELTWILSEVFGGWFRE